jgi:hypothetical protein
MTFLAYPDTEHPTYRQDAELIRQYLDRHSLVVAEPSGPPLVASYQQQDTPVSEPSARPRTLTVQKARGPVPYVGRPFAYEWRVAVDEAGRWVAGPAEVVYLPPDYMA